MALEEEAFALSKEYQKKKSAALESNTPLMLDSSIKNFVEFLEKEGFTVSYDENSKIKADSGDGVIIRLDRKANIFTVYMSNGEQYSITVESTLEDIEMIKEDFGKIQDYQISYYQKLLETSKEQIKSVEQAEYRYILHTESISPLSQRIKYDKKAYKNFRGVLEVLFS
jgi:hypothetical protein